MLTPLLKNSYKRIGGISLDGGMYDMMQKDQEEFQEFQEFYMNTCLSSIRWCMHGVKRQMVEIVYDMSRIIFQR